MNHKGDHRLQTKDQKINTPRQICWSKNRDFDTTSEKIETPRHGQPLKKQDCETHENRLKFCET